MEHPRLEHLQLWIETEERQCGTANTCAEHRIGKGNKYNSFRIYSQGD